MKNPEQWRPGKYVYRNGKLAGSKDPQQLAVSSRLVSDVTARHYDAILSDHCRGSLLDLGCGPVPLYLAYRDHVSSTTCVDWQTGDKGISHIDYQCDLSKALPFEDGAFDTILVSDVLEHIPTPDALWEEITRILAPGGKVIMNTPFYYKIHERPHDYYRYTEFALTRFADNNQLSVVQLFPTGGIPEILTDICAKMLVSVPLIGLPLAKLIQSLTGALVKTTLGQKISSSTGARFPLGYLLVAKKAHVSSNLNQLSRDSQVL